VELHIRPAIPADIPAMIALAQEATAAAQWSQAQYERIFLRDGTPDRLALVVEEETGIAGFLIARAIDSEWEIENIVVAAPALRRGLGIGLVGELLRRARLRGAKAIFLEVRESNRAARALYEKSGFAVAGDRKGYYKNPDENAVVYRLDLTGFAS
jgi:[ribosomal protein S18]-alanine N-acetyltransferase